MVNDEANNKHMLVQQPDYDNGRLRNNPYMAHTKQIVPYSNLQHHKILQELLIKQEEECKPENLQRLPEHE